MEIQPIVIGTAGHIDHGKSSLVRRLTGIDPDRLKEEKARGLTIDLGFAPLELPDGRTVGIVDVPGHERFIRNMVAGATGIDLVVLVVAADDGVMPQTREHLDIMSILGIERGFVALNKIDLVDEETAELAAEDVREAVAGTFLEGAPVLPVSATTGAGIDELRATLEAMAAEARPRDDEGVFRMPVQRVFSKQGFGTVVTGIPMSGRVKVGDSLEVLPAGVRGKVRGLQAYGQKTDVARAGHSTAINFSDVDHAHVERGHVVATAGFFRPVRMLGARLVVLAHLGFPVTNRMAVRLHVGTKEAVGELVLLDAEELAPGDTGLVQIRLEEPIVCAPGDRYVLRLASPAYTLGGGTILEESRHRLKRFKSFVIEELAHQESHVESPRHLMESHLARSRGVFVSTEELAQVVKRSAKEVEAIGAELESEGLVRRPGPPGKWMHTGAFDEALATSKAALDGWFAEHAHRRRAPVIELRKLLPFDPGMLQALLEELERRGELSLAAGGQVLPAGREVVLDEATRARRDALLGILTEAAFQPPSSEELCERLGASDADVARVLELLVDEGLVREVGKGVFLEEGAAARAEAEVVRNCERNGELAIPELRDALGTSRKFLIPLLEHFDARGVTLRQAGRRVLKRR